MRQSTFEQVENPKYKAQYSDRKLHTKYAMRDMLRRKYGTVGELNAAWGSKYTSFDSDGGWPHGKGFLEESGRGVWIGRDDGRLSGANPAVVTDLDEFLSLYAKRYFSVTGGRIGAHAPHALVFGPATLNGWGGLTRKEILRAAAEHVDVVQATGGEDRDYGDFISVVRKAHASVMQRLREEMGAAVSR